MADLVSYPNGLNMGSSTQPNNVMSVVLKENIAPAVDPADATYTRRVKTSPSLDQLANLSAGYAL